MDVRKVVSHDDLVRCSDWGGADTVGSAFKLLRADTSSGPMFLGKLRRFASRHRRRSSSSCNSALCDSPYVAAGMEHLPSSPSQRSSSSGSSGSFEFSADIPGAVLQSQSRAALEHSGFTHGLGLSAGASCTRSVPISSWSGYPGTSAAPSFTTRHPTVSHVVDVPRVSTTNWYTSLSTPTSARHGASSVGDPSFGGWSVTDSACASSSFRRSNSSSSYTRAHSLDAVPQCPPGAMSGDHDRTHAQHLASSLPPRGPVGLVGHLAAEHAASAFLQDHHSDGMLPTSAAACCQRWRSSHGGTSSSDEGSDSDCEEKSTRALAQAVHKSTQLQRHRTGSCSSRVSCPPTADGMHSPPVSRTGSRDYSSCGTGDERYESPPPLRSRTNYHLTDRHAAVELFLRVNHARQTLDYVKRQASTFAQLDKGEYSVWESLSMLNELREHEALLMGCEDTSAVDMPLLDHAFQTAELCRLAHPALDWLHLMGLMHGLGKLLAHRRWGSHPQWAVCGEAFPVGCRFSSLVEGSEYFIANPDRRRRQLNTRCGMYPEHCGLANVYMSWGAAEYLYLVLSLNETSLPPEALFVVRHQKFSTLLACGGSAYGHLLSSNDRKLLPLLAEFQQMVRYRNLGAVPGALQGAELRAYYDGLMVKYLGVGKLSW